MILIEVLLRIASIHLETELNAPEPPARRHNVHRYSRIHGHDAGE